MEQNCFVWLLVLYNNSEKRKYQGTKHLQRNLIMADFDHVLGNHFWTVSCVSHSQQNNALNCNFREISAYHLITHVPKIYSVQGFQKFSWRKAYCGFFPWNKWEGRVYTCLIGTLLVLNDQSGFFFKPSFPSPPIYSPLQFLSARLTDIVELSICHLFCQHVCWYFHLTRRNFWWVWFPLLVWGQSLYRWTSSTGELAMAWCESVWIFLSPCQHQSTLFQWKRYKAVFTICPCWFTVF